MHRDVKPSNILISEANFVKISDFGLSKKLEDGQYSCSVTAAMGTHLWTAPELYKPGTKAVRISSHVILPIVSIKRLGI